MFEPGFFRRLPIIPGAVEGVAALMANKKLDVYIGSKHSTKARGSASEKIEWVEEHFPALLKRMVLVCDKSLLRGDVLVDDDAKRWKRKFVGKFIHFRQAASQPIMAGCCRGTIPCLSIIRMYTASR